MTRSLILENIDKNLDAYCSFKGESIAIRSLYLKRADRWTCKLIAKDMEVLTKKKLVKQ